VQAKAYAALQDRAAHMAESVKTLNGDGLPTPALQAMNNHTPGAKADDGKLDLTLVPTQLEEAVCKILMFGARKYSRDGWRKVENPEQRYFAALERHLKAYKRGNDEDPESGLSHLAHAACNIAFLLFFEDRADANGKRSGTWRFPK
jgi:hypothetical protein